MIIQILVTGDSGSLSSFHSNMAIVLNKLKQQSDQVLYSCLADHYPDIEKEAMKFGLGIFKWDDVKKEWIPTLKKSNIQNIRQK